MVNSCKQVSPKLQPVQDIENLDVMNACWMNALVPHPKEIWIYVFLEKELRGLSPNFHIHSYVRPSYFPASE